MSNTPTEPSVEANLPPLGPLARAIARQLIRRIRDHAGDDAKPSITYGQLAATLGKHSTHPRSTKLHAALTEVTLACRALGLPVLPAIVWRADVDRPSDGYYKVAHPRVRSFKRQVAAWEVEYALVCASKSDTWSELP